MRARLPAVTIIVPVFNEEEVILSALRSLLALDYRTSTSWWSTTDRPIERASSRDAGGKLRRRHSPGGEKNERRKGVGAQYGNRAVATTPMCCAWTAITTGPANVARGSSPFADTRVGAVAGNVKVE